MIVAIVCLLALLVTIQLARLVANLSEIKRATPTIDQYVGFTVVLHLRDKSIQGTLVEAAPDALTLARAKLLGPSGPIEADGRQVVDRARVDFHQVLFETLGEDA